MNGLPPVGAAVEAVGLVSQASLNGTRGTVISHQTPAASDPSGISCAVVRFDGNHPPMALKAQNLQVVGAEKKFAVGDSLEAHGLKNSVALNGIVGKVLSVQETNGTTVYTTEFPSPHGIVQVGTRNAREPQKAGADAFPVGARVQATGLISQTAMNGQVGTVVSVQLPETVVVQFPPPYGTVALKMKNLTSPAAAQAALAPPAAPAAQAPAAAAAAAAPAAAAPSPTPASPTTNGGDVAQLFPVASEVQAQGIQSRPDMNGAAGTVMGHRAGPDGKMQVIVRFQVHGTVALLPSNLKSLAAGNTLAQEFPLGTMVRAHSMQHNVSLEGAVGKVMGHNEQAGQVVVLFSHNFGMVALKRSNCARAEGPAPTLSTTQDAEMQRALNSLRAPQVPSVLQEGFLNKKTPAVGRDFDRRWFVLRGTNLIYYEEKGRIPLTAQHAVQEANEGFTLNGPGMSRMFELKADTFAAKLSWIGALEKVIQNKPDAQNCMLQLDALESAARYKVESEWAHAFPFTPLSAPGGRAIACQVALPNGTAGSPQLEAKVAALEQQLEEQRTRLSMAEESKSAMAQALQASQDMQGGANSAVSDLESAKAGLESRVSDLEARASAAEQRAAAAEAELAQAREDHAARVAALEEQGQAMRRDAEAAAAAAAAVPAVAAVPAPVPMPVPVPEAVAPVMPAVEETPVPVPQAEAVPAYPEAVEAVEAVPQEEVVQPAAAQPEPVAAAPAAEEFAMVDDDEEVVVEEQGGGPAPTPAVPSGEVAAEAVAAPVVAEEAAAVPAPDAAPLGADAAEDDSMFLLAD